MRAYERPPVSVSDREEDVDIWPMDVQDVSILGDVSILESKNVDAKDKQSHSAEDVPDDIVASLSFHSASSIFPWSRLDATQFVQGVLSIFPKFAIETSVGNLMFSSFFFENVSVLFISSFLFFFFSWSFLLYSVCIRSVLFGLSYFPTSPPFVFLPLVSFVTCSYVCFVNIVNIVGCKCVARINETHTSCNSFV